jgi:putative phosphonate metabolism protein
LRYALYFTPPAYDPLTRSAALWLGRDPFSGEPIAVQETGPFPAEAFAALTEDPRRYGFHATIKAPFELAPDRTEAELIAGFEAFCAARPAFEIPSVVVGQLGPFFALIPAQPHPPLQDFAAAAVEAFEPFRATLSDADIVRRKPERLSEAQRAHLLRWGYPYVMDEFRFHMTLTGPVEPGRGDAMRELASARFAAFTDKPLAISGLALFVERERGAPFTVHTWQPLAGA